MEAIQAAIRETAPRRTSHNSTSTVEPTRLALISDDRIAEAARPVLIDLANRWARTAFRALKSYLPGTWQLDMVSADVIDGSTVKEELRGGWVAGLAGGETELVLATHGGGIESAAAKRCGATEPTSDPQRAPSAVALKLFQPTGKALTESFATAWRETMPVELTPSSDIAIVARAIAAQTIIRVALAFSGAVSGRVQLYAKPEMVIARPAALAAIKANAIAIANALSNVPIEVVVELGTLRMPLGELRKMQRGAMFTLQGFVDSRVPVYCGGALKAWARPVVCRGVLAVQIESIVHGQGTKS